MPSDTCGATRAIVFVALICDTAAFGLSEARGHFPMRVRSSQRGRSHALAVVGANATLSQERLERARQRHALTERVLAAPSRGRAFGADIAAGGGEGGASGQQSPSSNGSATRASIVGWISVFAMLTGYAALGLLAYAGGLAALTIAMGELAARLNLHLLHLPGLGLGLGGQQ